jgi:hypothetical protein
VEEKDSIATDNLIEKKSASETVREEKMKLSKLIVKTEEKFALHILQAAFICKCKNRKKIT